MNQIRTRVTQAQFIESLLTKLDRERSKVADMTEAAHDQGLKMNAQFFSGQFHALLTASEMIRTQDQEFKIEPASDMNRPRNIFQSRELAAALIRNSAGIQTNAEDLAVHFQSRYGVNLDPADITAALKALADAGEIKRSMIDHNGLNWYQL